MPPRPPLSPNAEGALWMLVSVPGATGMTLAVRLLSPELHTAMLAFLRSALAGVLVLPFLMRAQRAGKPLRFTAWKLHLIRGALIAVALNAGFYSIWKLPLATATILFFMAPVFATALAIPFFGEKVGPRRWAAIGAGFLGAVVILRPGFGAFDPAMLVALGSSVAFALTLMIGRRISAVDGSDSVFVSSSLVVVVFTLPAAVPVWELPGSLWSWGIMAVLVVCSSLRTYADIRAYAVGEAGLLAPFSYLRLLTIGVIGWAVFDEVIDAPTLAGGAIIIASTLYIALREARLKPGRGAPRLP